MCVIFLYVSYVVPTGIGLVAHGRWWTAFGPWTLGAWFRPLAVVSVVGCVGLIVIGMQPPNDQAVYAVGGMAVLLAVGWLVRARRTFPGPPHGVLNAAKLAEIRAAEEAVHEPPHGKPA